MNRIVVLEANEVPLRVLKFYAEEKPTSTIAFLLRDGTVLETDNRDDLGERELYPSQTWATVGTGVAYEKHGIYWYADPKSSEFPFYWQTSATCRRVGTVGTLHSFPIPDIGAYPGFDFCVPDTFSPTPETRPAHLQPLQEFSLRMANKNARAVADTRPWRDYVRGIAAVFRARVRLRTFIRLGRMALTIAVGRTPKERLRTAHAVLMFDVFKGLVKRRDPDLAVFFTNHVAAAMHRYWFATFPDDWAEELYDQSWRESFSGEIVAALDVLDSQLADLVDLCDRTNRQLVLLSSMGQHGGEPLRESASEVFVVRDAEAFLLSLGFREFEVRAAMVPQVSAEFADAKLAQEAIADVGRHPELQIDRAGAVVTVTYEIPVSPNQQIILGGSERSPQDYGGEITKVSEHRNGMHHPLGTLMVWPSMEQESSSGPVDAREVAPALLRSMGVPEEPHHMEASFVL